MSLTPSFVFFSGLSISVMFFWFVCSISINKIKLYIQCTDAPSKPVTCGTLKSKFINSDVKGTLMQI